MIRCPHGSGPRRGLLFGVACLLAGSAGADPSSVARDVVNDQELRARMSAVPRLKQHLEKGSVPRADVAVARPQLNRDLIARSILLHDGRFFTLLPPGSILHLPTSRQDRILSEPKGDFLTWSAFLERNAAWLKTQEVSLETAKGNVKQVEQITLGLAQDPKVVIAVHQGGPISLLQPETPTTLKP